MKRFSPDKTKEVARQIAQAVGVPKNDAAVFADALVAADLNGTATHGISRLNIYIRRIQKGLIEPAAELKVTHRKPAALSVDAGNGLGHPQAVKVLDLMIPIAREYGVCTATVRRSQHFGALSYYGDYVARKDMILLGTTSCEPAMSPEGGCEPFFGTNPIAASFPTGKPFQMNVDLSTSIVARGHIVAAAKESRPIPDHWAMDPDGNATTDAARALEGTVRTMAGHKGYALACMVEGLSSVLSGAAVGNRIGSMYKDFDRPQDVGHFFCVLDVGAFMDTPSFTGRMSDMIDRIHNCRKRPDAERIYVPGERSHERAEHNRREGITLSDATLKEIEALAGELGVPFAL
jgi:LDH2 family malate/lactate/ureidoglycolate dehydrogenase